MLIYIQNSQSLYCVCKVKLLDKFTLRYYNLTEDMNKIEFMRLWDLYGGLLTPTQRGITDLYFNLDLTVSEIAEQKGITRQGVSECLSLCKKQLKEYDDKLKHDRLLAEGDIFTSKILTGVNKWADEFLRLHPEYAADIAVLTGILNKDYTEEIAEDLKKLGKE